MGKKQDMPPQHRSPDQPEPGEQKGRPGVVDARASSAVDAEQGARQVIAGVDPELQAARDEVQANFARYQRLAADFENYKRRTRQELADRTQYASEETDEHEEGTIVEEMQPGYRLHERVLRPTLVKVAHPRALKS